MQRVAVVLLLLFFSAVQTMNINFKDKVVLVTGASSGIGRGIAEAFGRSGAKVAINYMKQKGEAEEVLASIEDSGGSALVVQADVSEEAEVLAMFEETREHFGDIDILINNAGIQADSSFLNMSFKEWTKVIEVNLSSQFLCAREAARHFMMRGMKHGDRSVGCIICVSSVHELIPWAGHVNYAASKGGIMQLMKSIAQELGEHKIRINSIAPGAIKTPINEEVWSDKEKSKELLKLIPYGRIGEVEDVANVALFLASDYADYIHGTTIFIDGGMTLFPAFADNG